MSDQTDLDPVHSALLSMDCQNGIVSRYVREQEEGSHPASMMQRAAEVIKRARRAGMRAIHIRVGFRPNMPEISPRNPLFRAIKNSPQHQSFFQGSSGEIHPAVAPEGDEAVITKHRVGAFTGTDFDMILRANDIHTVVLFGIATSGVVLATLLQALDADYRVFVVKDCCADLDPEVHACLVDKVFPRYATVLSSDQFPAS